MITEWSLKTQGRDYGKKWRQILSAASRIADGNTVAFIGCKDPGDILSELEKILSKKVLSEPIHNGQGRKLGEMIHPEDDTPIGYSFRLEGVS